MARWGRKAKAGRPEELPSAEDFTSKALYKAVLKDTVQHPLTILPATVAVLGALYMGLFGLDPAPFALALGGGALGLGAWVFNYYIRGEELARKKAEELQRRRRQFNRQEMLALEEDWAQLGHAEGAKQARELREAYDKLAQFLKGRFAATGGLNAERLRILAEDTYREGASILGSALEMQRALGQFDVGHLRRELAEWQAELAARRAAKLGDEDPRTRSLLTRIGGHERRLQLLAQRRHSVDELLAESELLESALESTYLEAVSLESPEALLSRGEASAALERAVEAARRVEERLRAAEGSDKDDEIYLNAQAGSPAEH